MVQTGATGTPEHLGSSGEGGNHQINHSVSMHAKVTYIHHICAFNAFCYADIAGDVYVGTTDEEDVEEPGWCYKLQKL